jgi:tRNA U34 5-methylaminomethyl-2-thiouridine-forming methyltransferase MnmC
MKLVVTADGSHTIWLPEINEHYHSAFGAVTESEHIFIRSGLDIVLGTKDNLTVFEVGFGTGLNAYLTGLKALKTGKRIHYYAIEKYPVPYKVVESLNYPVEKENPALFYQIHECGWDSDNVIHSNFTLNKINSDVTGYKPPPGIDLVYFDAFSPEVQPEMWTAEIFNALYLSMNSGGILTTYCVKGSVKRTLRNCGFEIEKIPGPPGKREILRARKI